MSRHPALVVDGDSALREAARAVMSDVGFAVRFVERVDEALFVLAGSAVSVILLDPRGSGSGPDTFLAQALRARPDAVPIVVGSPETPDASLLDAGAFEVVPRNPSRERLLRAVGRALRQHDQLAELARVRAAMGSDRPVPSLVGRSEAMAIFREKLDAAAESDDPILLIGEPGSGSTSAVRLLHALSARSRGPFVVHEAAGADAAASAASLRVAADAARGGTLLIRVGDRRAEPALISAIGDGAGCTTADGARLVLSLAVARGSAELDPGWLTLLAPPREVHAVRVPPLRDRGRDALLLSRHFIDRIRRRNGLPPVRISPDAICLIEAHDWPGNVRELREAVEHAMTLAANGIILASHIPEAVRRTSARIDASNPASRARRFREAKKKIVDAFERSYLEDLLAWHRGNVTTAAEQAGMLRSALQRLLRKHELRSDAFRRETGSRPDADA